MRNRTMLAALILIAAAGIPSRLTAQYCGYFYECSGGEHTLPAIVNSNENPHDNCMSCISGICHPLCGGGDLARNPALKKTYEAVVAAANAGDVQRVLKLAAAVPGFVMFNAERQSVQITTCTRTSVVANLPIRSEGVLRLAMSLPPASKMQVAAATGALVAPVSRARVGSQ